MGLFFALQARRERREKWICTQTCTQYFETLKGVFYVQKNNKKGRSMTKEQLKGLGLTDEQVEKVWGEFDGKYIPKHRFDEINSELKQVKDSVKERDGQLETLKKSTGDVEGMKKQIEELQTENKTKEETHASEIKALRVETALTNALTGAKAKNAKAVKALLALDTVELDENGGIKGLDDQLKALKEKETYLFESEQPASAAPQFKGVVPAAGKDRNNQTGGAKSLADAVKANYEKKL
jgi:hypothetical protein